jgi:regulator of replication initiation timing
MEKRIKGGLFMKTEIISKSEILAMIDQLNEQLDALEENISLTVKQECEMIENKEMAELEVIHNLYEKLTEKAESIQDQAQKLRYMKACGSLKATVALH